MKFTKMSLVAALLVGSSAFAIDNIKVSGDANVFYTTNDSNSGDLFAKDQSAADTALNLNISADLIKNDLVSVSAKAGYTVLSTLGLENNLVSGVWGGAHTATAHTGSTYGHADVDGDGTDDIGGAKVENANWVNEAAISISLNKASKSTVSVGRMALDTPLAFTETWSVEKNTFEAAVLINQDIPDTTVVAAFVGNGNGTELLGYDKDTNPGANKYSNVNSLGLAAGAVVNANGEFTTYGTDGAYAVGLINNSFKPLTVQAWYYDVVNVATAYWLQADLKCQKIEGLLAGAQYSSVTSAADGAKEDNVYAVMLGYEMKDAFTAKVAYSSVNSDGSIGHAGFNTATAAGTAQSKLYTEAWWNYGFVTRQDTTAYNFTIEGSVKDVADLGLYVTYANQDEATGAKDLMEYALTASKTFGPLDATVAYVNYQYGKKGGETQDAVNLVQAYLTLNF